MGPLADKVVVVPDCVFGEFAYDPKPFNEECPVVLQVGTKWNKNVERVMEAVREAGCRLEIVGTISADRHTAGGIRHTAEGQGAGGGGQGTGGKRPTAYGRRHEAGEEEAGGKRHTVDGIRGDGREKAQEGEGAGGSRHAAYGLRQTEEWPRRGAGGAKEEDLKLTDLKFKDSGETGDRRQEAVKVLGKLTDEELVEAYRRCDMVVFASLYEGFGLPILEAQAMGRPVITSNFGAMREAAGDGALLVDPYSVEAIREAVLRITREPALREDLIAKGLRNAERFRADAVAARYAEIYRGMARGR